MTAIKADVKMSWTNLDGIVIASDSIYNYLPQTNSFTHTIDASPSWTFNSTELRIIVKTSFIVELCNGETYLWYKLVQYQKLPDVFQYSAIQTTVSSLFKLPFNTGLFL
jgi:hypothetical protein